MLVIAAAGALSAVALASGSPLTWGLCFVAAFALFGVRWVAAAPARATLAAARVSTLGAATLVAAAPFLPVDATAVPPRAHLAGGLLAGGVAAGFALVPLGGWVSGGGRLLRGAALAPWALLLVPALVLTSQPLQSVLPVEARLTFAAILLPAGAISAAWGALRGLSVADRDRYARVLLADLGLVAMGLATPLGGARLGSLLLMLTHLCVGPLLLHEPWASSSRPRRLAWAALSGVPPSPAFWGRFALVTALAGAFGGTVLLAAIPVVGAVMVIALRAAMAASPPRPRGPDRPRRAPGGLGPAAGGGDGRAAARRLPARPARRRLGGMDPTGLLDAVLAVAVYPGVAFLAVAAVLHGRLAGRRDRRPARPGSRGQPAAGACGQRGHRDAPDGGRPRAPPATDRGGRRQRRGRHRAAGRRRRPGGGVALGVGARRRRRPAGDRARRRASTVSVVAVTTAGGGAALAARVVAAALLVLAGSVASAGRAASAVSAALALCGAALVIPLCFGTRHR